MIISIWEMRVEKPYSGPLFSSIFENLRKNNGQASFVAFALRLYNSYNHSHAPGLHMWPSHGPEPDSKCSKRMEVGCSCQELKPCQTKKLTDEIQEKNYRVCSNIIAHVQSLKL